MLQCWNEAIHECFSLGFLPKEGATATISLTTGTREYALPSDFERMGGVHYADRVMRGATTGLLIYEYPGGYSRMLADQPIASDYTGDPMHWAFSPVDDVIRMDREATADQNLDTYNFLYEKRINLTSTMATTSLPMSDTAVDSLVPVVAEMWDRVFKKEYDDGFMRRAMSRALGYQGRSQPRSRWGG